MVGCYHPQAQFSDPIFGLLNAQEATDMWHMLCVKAQEFELKCSHIHADETFGSACWVVKYRFPQTERYVNNVIFAEFQFSEGKIIRHSAYFNFWRWSKSALGMRSLLLDWSGYLRRNVQQQALTGLQRFSRKTNLRKDLENSI